MKIHARSVLAVAAFVVAASVLTAGDDEAIQKDRKQMTGTWRVISYEKDGKKTPAEQLEKNRTVFSVDGKFMVQKEGKTLIHGSTVIDPTKKPKHSDATFTEGEVTAKTLGIYEVDGDNMKICYAFPGKDRPTEFSLKPGSGQVLIVYKRDGQAKPFTNSFGMKFVWIPPGSFMMGSPANEDGRQKNETQHKVTLTKGFYMGVHAVTQEQWHEIMGTNPSHFKGEKNLPVEMVSWGDCQEFVKKLREKDKKLYRLPTEAEWEYACRAGTTTPFPFGETISSDQANYRGDITYGDGKKGIYRAKTTPVDSFPANAWGLHDMSGNVYQWCQDWYGEYPQKDAVDPQGPEMGRFRVLRGGSSGVHPRFCRSASRMENTQNIRYKSIGLRVCFSVE